MSVRQLARAHYYKARIIGARALKTLWRHLKTLGDHGSEATWVKDAEQKIKEAKRYLKTEFKLAHVGRDETCADHCTAHALGDTSDSNLESICQHKHETECEQCESHCKLCLASIQDWKAHLLRTQNQEEGKQFALARVDSASCLIVVDWAMKYRPQHYRERRSDFFGKRA